MLDALESESLIHRPRVTVMKNGQVVGTGRVEDMTKDEVLGMIILGKCPPGAVPGPGAMVN